MDILMIILKWYSVVLLAYTVCNCIKNVIKESTEKERRSYFFTAVMLVPILVYLLIK